MRAYQKGMRVVGDRVAVSPQPLETPLPCSQRTAGNESRLSRNCSTPGYRSHLPPVNITKEHMVLFC